MSGGAGPQFGLHGSFCCALPSEKLAQCQRLGTFGSATTTELSWLPLCQISVTLSASLCRALQSRNLGRWTPVDAMRDHVVDGEVGRCADVPIRQLLKDDCCISSAQGAAPYVFPAVHLDPHAPSLLKPQPVWPGDWSAMACGLRRRIWQPLGRRALCTAEETSSEWRAKQGGSGRALRQPHT